MYWQIFYISVNRPIYRHSLFLYILGYFFYPFILLLILPSVPEAWLCECLVNAALCWTRSWSAAVEAMSDEASNESQRAGSATDSPQKPSASLFFSNEERKFFLSDTRIFWQRSSTELEKITAFISSCLPLKQDELFVCLSCTWV